jgi:acyl-CoA thioester hydrolase
VVTAPLPSYDDVAAAPVHLEGTVSADFVDANGHMNIRHYLEYGGLAVDALCNDVGIDDAYRADRRSSVFTAEHHLRYASEMLLAEQFTVHALALDRSAKAVHLMAFLLDRTNQRLASTLEAVLVHVDMDTRRPTPIPADVAERWDRHVAVSREMSWQPPVCGAMGVRR